MTVITYTGVFGGYDTLQPARWPSICFCDGLLEPVRGWQYHTIFSGRGPQWANRHVKILAHEHLDAEYTIYHDGNIQMFIEPGEAVRRWLSDADMAVFAHPEARDCVYQEAEEVIRQGKAKLPIVDGQMTRYHREGFPAHYGLSACYVLVRRHTRAVQEFCELWWQEYEQGAKRDQLSFDYVRWRTGLKVATIPGNLFEFTSPDFRRKPHRRAELQRNANWRTAYGKMLLPDERQFLVDAARNAAAKFPQPVIVNIGIFRFASMLCLRAGAPDAELVGVDIKAPDGEAPGIRAYIIIGDSREVHTDVDKPVHLVFIDGDHHYATVKADLENWANKLAPGGVVILHDYAPQPKHLVLLPELEGVRRATNEWAARVKWERLPAPDSLAAFRRPTG